MYEFQFSTKFRRDVKKCERQSKDMSKFKEIMDFLQFGQPLQVIFV